MKALAGSCMWGKAKETLVNTYKTIGRSVLNYAAPIWSPSLSRSNWKSLQACQNNAIRIATGCTKMADSTHLHTEAKLLPVKSHNDLLSKQFLMSMHSATHPNHTYIADYKNPSRIMKRTLMNTYRQEINHLIPPTNYIDDNVRKYNLKKIHTDHVKSAIDNYPPNRILGTRPPEINKEEISLPRSTRTKLAQLRSGFSPVLAEYMHRIGKADSNICPECKTSVQDCPHLFNCPARPTNLTTTDLWENPREVAEFLHLIPEEDEENADVEPG